ncbi:MULTISPECIES: hypothetical protein [Sorangium]|uniref:hypothetical protein n=1 Tax=Sorangium TaxID=39643 RepID=UPI003D9C23B6
MVALLCYPLPRMHFRFDQLGKNIHRDFFGLVGAAETETELPGDAWERRVALPWLVRLSFEVPTELLAGLPSEERDFIMETREWYEQTLKQAEERGIEHGIERGLERGLERGQLRMTARLCAMRLGRPLAEAEQAALASLLDRLGEERVGEAVLSFSAEALAAWLADPSAR